MVAKLSSVNTIAAASLATSVPLPIPIPILACLSAGASLTPSPVMAVTLPFSCHAFTILILFSGETLAYTVICSNCSLNSFSLKASNSWPVNALSPLDIMPSSLAMAAAVVLWSPVIIIVFIPALIASFTAPKTSFLGGSIIAISPTKVRSTSSSMAGTKFSSGTSLIEKANTLNALSENSSLICLYLFNISSVIGTSSPSFNALVDLCSTISGAPLTNMIALPPMEFTVDISFLSESKGISFNLSYFSLISL